MDVDSSLQRVVRREMSRRDSRARPNRSSPAAPAAQTRAVPMRGSDAQARQRMVEANLGLVYALARPYQGRGVPFADLVQEGTVGLMRAIEAFDHRRGVKLSTYAAWWIKRSLLDAIAAARPIRIPPQAARQLATVRRVEGELKRTGVKHASNESIAQRTGLSLESVRSLREAAHVSLSLDAPTGEDGRPFGDTIADPDGADPELDLVEQETRLNVQSLMRTLPPRHRQVLARRYGIGGGRTQSHSEIGAVLGVKEERSRQLEREALQRLRELTASPRWAA